MDRIDRLTVSFLHFFTFSLFLFKSRNFSFLITGRQTLIRTNLFQCFFCWPPHSSLSFSLFPAPCKQELLKMLFLHFLSNFYRNLFLWLSPGRSSICTRTHTITITVCNLCSWFFSLWALLTLFFVLSLSLSFVRATLNLVRH